MRHIEVYKILNAIVGVLDISLLKQSQELDIKIFIHLKSEVQRNNLKLYNYTAGNKAEVRSL